MTTQTSGSSQDRSWPFWTSGLWILEVATPEVRGSTSRFRSSHGRPTLIARRLAEQLVRLELHEDEPGNAIFVAERTTFCQAVLWWIETKPLLPEPLVRPQYPELALQWFGRALRARFGSMVNIHSALRAVARDRADCRDELLTESDLRQASIEAVLTGEPSASDRIGRS